MARNQVLVGYHGGPPGMDALVFALRWCRSSGDRLVVVTVHRGAAPPGIGRVDAEWAAAERTRSEQILQEARALVPSNVDAEFRRVEASSAARGLHDLAETLDDDPLVVLGTYKAHKLSRTFPGSTAERLFSGAASSVAIVPRGYASTSVDAPLTRVTAAFVDTSDGRVALEHAARIAQTLSASLRVVSVVPDTLVRPTMGEPRRFADEQVAGYRDALEKATAGVDASLSPTSALLDGPVAEALSDISPEDADLIVSGSRGYGPIRRVLLGGVSSKLVRHARVPVVVIPRSDRD